MSVSVFKQSRKATKLTFAVIDPDHIGSVQSDGITTPDILRIQVLSQKSAAASALQKRLTNRNVDVLEDDILHAIAEIEASSFDHAGTAHADDTLVTSNPDRVAGCIVVRTSLPGCTTGVHDPELAIGLTCIWTAVGRGGALVGGEVPCLRDHNDTSRGVRKLGHKTFKFISGASNDSMSWIKAYSSRLVG